MGSTDEWCFIVKWRSTFVVEDYRMRLSYWLLHDIAGIGSVLQIPKRGTNFLCFHLQTFIFGLLKVTKMFNLADIVMIL